jgi:hypothetical protein
MLPAGGTASSPIASPVTLPRVRAESRQFYVWMAYACAFVAIAGFTATYWAPVAAGSFVGPPILHVHGLLFSAWMLLFIAQARSAGSGRFEYHRSLGLVGISLATAMLFAGLMVAIASINGGAARGFDQQTRAFSIVPITIMLFFAATVAAAIANTRRPDVHMRLMLVASISLLPPAIARIFFFFLAPAGTPRPGLGEPPAVVFSLVPSFASDLLLVIAMANDWRTRGRPHPTYVITGVLMLALQIVRVPFSGTPAWRAVTDWLVALAG